MLFLLIGSSAAGKTFALDELRRRGLDMAIHDFDEIGVPPGADQAWRRRSNEVWIRRALDLQADGRDLLLAGQTPYAELLASPSATLLDAVAVCLIDCDDETRLARIRARGPEWLSRSGAELADYLASAEWLRHHAGGPGGWLATVDTSGVPVERVADAVVEWIETGRRR